MNSVEENILLLPQKALDIYESMQSLLNINDINFDLLNKILKISKNKQYFTHTKNISEKASIIYEVGDHIVKEDYNFIKLIYSYLNNNLFTFNIIIYPKNEIILNISLSYFDCDFYINQYNAEYLFNNYKKNINNDLKEILLLYL